MGPVEVEGVIVNGEGGDEKEGHGNGDHSSGHGDGVIGGWRPAEEDEDSGEDVARNVVDVEELVAEEDADLRKAREEQEWRDEEAMLHLEFIRQPQPTNAERVLVLTELEAQTAEYQRLMKERQGS